MNKFLALCVLASVLSLSLAAPGPSYNHLHYPNLQQGFQSHFYNYAPTAGQYGCRFWCRSFHTSQYYCCTTPNQAAVQNVGAFGGFGNNLNNYNPYNPYSG